MFVGPTVNPKGRAIPAGLDYNLWLYKNAEGSPRAVVYYPI